MSVVPKFCHISFMINQLHWRPLTTSIFFKILALVLKSKLGVAPKYLRDHIYLQLYIDHSALQTGRLFLFCELGPLSPKLDPCNQWAGPSLWNALPSSLCLTLL